MAATASLKDCIDSLLKLFHKYASMDGDKETMTKKEVKAFLQKEMPELLENPDGADCVTELVDAMDDDGDKKLNFMEFVPLVVSLCYMTFFLPQIAQCL